MKLVVTFARFWWDFVVGDEWRIALAVAVVTVVGGLAAAHGSTDGSVIALAVGSALMLVAAAIILIGGRRRGATPPS